MSVGKTMRKIISIFLCFQLVIAFLAPNLLASDVILTEEATGHWEEVPIVNGGFEDPKTATNVGINGWRYHPSLYQTGAELSTEMAAEGNQSLKYTGASAMGVETLPIAVTPGAKYSVTYSVYISSLEGNPSIWLRWFDDASGAVQVGFSSNPIPQELEPNQWHEITFEVTVPENITYARILINATSTTKLVGYFDSFKLYKYVEPDEEDPDLNEPDPTDPKDPADPVDPVDPAPSPWKRLEIENAGFEEPVIQDAPENTLPIQGWKYLNTGYRKGAAISTADKAEGSQSLYFSGEKNMGVETNPYPVKGGTQYKATIQANVQHLEGQIRIWLRWYENGSHLSDTYLTVPSIELNTWKTLEITGTAPVQATHGSVLIYASSQSSITGYFDDLRVYAYEPVVEDEDDDDPSRLPVINGSFEDPVIDGRIPGWSFWESGLKTGVTVTDEMAYRGTKSLKLTNVRATGLESTLIPIISNEQYTVTAQVYLTDYPGERGPGIWIRWYTSNNTLINADSIMYLNNATLHEWNLLEVTGRAPSEAAYAMIFLYATGSTTLNGYLDDVRMYHVVNEDELKLPYSYGSPIDLGDATVSSETSGAVVANGEIYFATNGSPSTFYAIDAASGEVIASQSLPGVNVVWAITAGSDNRIYFGGTTDGQLYRYDPQSKQVTKLGKNPAGEFIWDLDASADGKIYGGTYPTGEMFEYDIANEQFKNLGVLKEGQMYVRGTGVSGEYAYGGTGSFAYLYKIHRETGEKTEIPLPITGSDTMISNIWKHNDLLFIAYGTSLIILNEETNETLQHWHWQDAMTFDGALSDPSPLDKNLVYFRNKNTSELMVYHLENNEVSPVGPNAVLPQETLKAMKWTTLSAGEKAGKPVLIMVGITGRYTIYDPEDQSLTDIRPEIALQGVYVNSLETGPDGKLYMGGYMGSYSIYDPSTGKYVVQDTNMNQSEGIGFYNGKVYFGTYGSAVIYRYDPEKPVNYGETPEHNPGLIKDIEYDQDRPFVMKSGGGKLFIGTFPVYGHLGGAITVYDEAENSWETYRHVVYNQSIFGLAYGEDGLLYGGTSINGGLGIEPTEQAAKLFVWNPETGETVKEFVPQVPGIATPKLVGDLTFDSNGLLWGGIAGVNDQDQIVMGIFAYHPEKGTIEKSKILVQADEIGSMYRPYYLRWENGLLYTTIGRQLIVVDPETLNHTKLLDQTVNLMTIGHDGSVYYVYGSKLFKLPVQLDSVLLRADRSELQVHEETALHVEGKLINGRPAYVYAGTIAYETSDDEIVAITDGVLKAKKPGTAEVWATVTLDRITKVTERITITVTEPTRTKSPSVSYGGPASTNEPVIETVQELRRNGKEELVYIVGNRQAPKDQAGKNFVLSADDASKPITFRFYSSLIQDLADQGVSLTILTPHANVILPAHLLADDAFASLTGETSLEVSIAPSDEQIVKKAERAIQRHGSQLIGAPVVLNFRITDAGRNAVALSSLASFFELQISLPEDAALSAVTTSVIVGEDGTLRHVPTKLRKIDGKNTAIINSLSNGTYALLRHSAAFTDMEQHWAESMVQELADRLIVKGRTGHSFAPDAAVTRAEFSAMMARALGLQARAEAPYRDVSAGDWYYDAIATANRFGLVEGYEDGTFRPDERITREQAMAMISRTKGIMELPLDASSEILDRFADRQLISPWAEPYVAESLHWGVVTGRTATTIDPTAQITRAEAAAMVYRLLQISELIQ